MIQEFCDIEVTFRDHKLSACCASEREAKRKWAGNARKVLTRLALLASADALSDLEEAPGRCHALKGDRAGEFAMDLWGSTRLVFEVADDPAPVLGDGGLDRSRVTKVRILEVVDYHGN